MSAKTIAFAPRRKGGDAPLVINADTIRYIQMKRNYAEVHLYLAHHHGGAGAALRR